MASMMGGDFVEAYVLRNAYKEKMRRMDEAAPPAIAGVEGKNSKEGGAGGGSAGEKKAAGANIKGGFFGLMKKKVHPKATSPSS
jgi:hypothetical protein